MPDLSLMATRYAGRPLLLEPRAARDLAMRIRALDGRAFSRPSRLDAFLRKVGLSGASRRQPMAMEDADMDDYDAPPPVPMEQRLAYSPRWAGDVEDTGFCWSLKDGVALMCCDTPLVANGDEFCGVVWHGYDTLLMAMQEAVADARVRGIFLVLDTPGGVVDDGLPLLAEFMRGARASAGGKPIWIYAKMACSAGYWIASQGDRIIAPATGYVGSLGAVIVHENYAGMLEQDGIEITSIEFPAGGEKTDGAWWKALSHSAKAAWTADVDQCGALFFADVEAGRPAMTHDKQLALRAGVFMGAHTDPARSGLAIGLVDEIAHEQAAFEALVAEVSASDPGTKPARASGSGARANTPKEKTMATAPKKTAAQAAPARVAALAKARAEVTRLEAEGEGDAPAAEADEEADPAAEAPADDADPAEEAEEDEDGEEAEEDKPQVAEATTEAAKISASTEADSHPHLAMAAIRSGQTHTQFLANVAAAGKAPRKGALAQAMETSRRLAPDARSPASEGGLGGLLLADAKKRAEAARRK